MPRMHQMTLALQSEELNIIDALVIIESTVKLLKSIREDESSMNELIDAGIVFLRKISSEDPVNEFRRKHRRRQTPICFDKNPETTAEFQMHQFYRMEFYKFLDLIIKEYGENLSSCFNKLKPLIVVLKPPLSEPTIEDIKSVVKFFPRETKINAYILHGELCNFVAHIDLIFLNDSFVSLNEIAQYSEKKKSIFPLTNKCYQLLLTIPVTVAKDERTFSRLKLVKTSLRSTMGDKRLESLLLLSCEKDITDGIDFDEVAKDWAGLKTRRIQNI